MDFPGLDAELKLRGDFLRAATRPMNWKTANSRSERLSTELRCRFSDARVVDEQLNEAELGLRGDRGGGYGVHVRHVHRLRGDRVVRGELCFRLLQSVRIAVAQADVRAELEQA